MWPTIGTESISLIILVAAGFLSLIMIFAILRIFSIDRTLREILEILKKYEGQVK